MSQATGIPFDALVVIECLECKERFKGIKKQAGMAYMQHAIEQHGDEYLREPLRMLKETEALGI